jgi:hypothetical protein
MPESHRGKALAAIYLIAVAGSTLLWAVQGAYSPAVLLTVVLTLPWSILGYVVLYVASMVLMGLGGETGMTTAIWTALLLVLFPALAVSNVFIAQALRRAHERRTSPPN